MRSQEHLRLLIKGQEFRMSPRVIRACASILDLKNPYREQEHRMQCLFIHVPKAAGTSVARALFNDKSRHIALRRYWAFDSSAAASYFKFTFVRDPWDRFLSAYRYLARVVDADPAFPDHRWATHFLASVGDFHGFVEKMMVNRAYRAQIRNYIHFRDQSDWLFVPGHGLPVDFIGRFESLERDFEEIRNRLGVERGLPHERQHASNQDLSYTPTMLDFIGDLYQRDIRQFGYER